VIEVILAEREAKNFAVQGWTGQITRLAPGREAMNGGRRVNPKRSHSRIAALTANRSVCCRYCIAGSATFIRFPSSAAWRSRDTGKPRRPDPIEGAEAMFNLPRSTGLCVLLACGLPLSTQAQAFDLTGAWATSTDQCKKIFVKKGNQISFAQYSDEFGGGFVANGNEIRNKAARCTIKSRKETGDIIDLHAACASEIIASSIQLKIKILNSNSVSRIFPDPDFAGMEITFYRCSM
jgi:hypothetical protein